MSGCPIRRSPRPRFAVQLPDRRPPPRLHARGFRNTISVDQLAAERRAARRACRACRWRAKGSGISWTRSGALVPSRNFPSQVFYAAVHRRAAPRRSRRSAAAPVRAEPARPGPRGARRMNRVLGAADREKLEEYLTSVRDLEKQLGRSEEWSKKPKPKVDAKPPQNATERRRLHRQGAALVRSDPPGAARPTRPGSSRSCCWAPAPSRRSPTCRSAITTSRTTARIRGSWISSRRWRWS
jgi:hypothetical protein